jgi:colanic acid/amylovoran biosynthesis glycosyltransferase
VDSVDTADRPRVAHYVKRWLEPTHTWIHAQVIHQRRWQSMVLSERLQRPVRFPAPDLVSLGTLPLPVRLLNLATIRVRGFAPALRTALRRSNVRVLHAHFGMAGYRAMPLARAAGIPLVTTFYGADLSLFPRRDPRWRQRYARLFEAGTLFLLEGPHMREQLIALGCPPDKAIVQRLGVDLERFAMQPRAPDGDGTVRILACGRFTEKKGIPHAIAAFAQAHRAFPQARLTIIGDAAGGEDSTEKRAILDAIRTHDVAGAVELRGAQPYEALIAAYAEHHILLAPSVTAANGDNEGGSPVVITEAQATGMPVVATRHCDIPAVVQHGRTGFLAAERDVAGLGVLLTELLARPERWPALGAAGRAHIEAEYDVRRQADRLAGQYEEAARRHAERYWTERVRRLGRRSVFHAGHPDDELDAVTAKQRAVILPVLDRLRTGGERIALDYGCGWGRFTGDLATRVTELAIGMDPVPDLLVMAPRAPRTVFLAPPPGAVPLRTGTVDLLWVCLVLGAIVEGRQLAETCAELRRVLRPGGLMLLVENTTASPDAPHFRFRSVAAYRRLFPDVALEPAAAYDDRGETITVMAGRRTGAQRPGK